MTLLRSFLFTITLVTGSASVSSAQDLPSSIPKDPLENDTMKLLQIRALDKITARITELDIPLNKVTRFGTLAIFPRYCRSRPPEEQPETFAYLEIDDIKHDKSKVRAFEGWMVASNPALNALEHPVYDIWVLNCKIVSTEASGAKE